MNWDIAIYVLVIIVYSDVLEIKKELKKWTKTN